MTPDFYTKLADRFFPFRWWFLGAAVCSMVFIVALFSLHVVSVAAFLAGPMIGLPWAALCASTWFHPIHGNMQPNGARFGRLPTFVQAAVRWYAAIFLAVFVVFCGVLWPLFTLSVVR